MKEHINDDSNNSRRARRDKLRSIRERNMMRNRRMLKIRLAVLAASLLAVLVAYLFLTLWMKALPR
jgi:cell division septal protein FtsQ